MAGSDNRYLIVGPAWVGDLVMAQVLFKWIKHQHPDAVIDVLASNHSGPVLACMPEVRRHILLPLDHGHINLGLRYQIGRSLRGQYDKAIVLPNSLKSALIPFWAKIKHRTGWLGEMRWGLLNDVRYLNKASIPSMIQRFVVLANETCQSPDMATLPKPALTVTDELKVQTLSILALSKPKKPVLALCTGAEFGPAKRWPIEYYAELAGRKHQAGWDVWLLGSPKEQSDANKIQALTGQVCTVLTGQTTLTQAIALLSLASVVVANDSGLMHIAAALNRPLIVIYGSSSPKFTPPLSDQARLLYLDLACSPCFKRVCPLKHLKCLTELKADTVLNVIDTIDV